MKRARVFFNRSQKVVLSGKDRQIVIPFRSLSAVGILALLLASVFLLLRSDIFNIHKVSVSDAKDCATQEGVIQNVDLLGRSIFFADFEKSRKSLLKHFACLEDVTFTKHMPDKVTAQTVFRQPRALIFKRKMSEATISAQISTESAKLPGASADIVLPIATDSAHPIYLIDRMGVIFAQGNSGFSLPTIEMSQNYDLVIGEKTGSHEVETFLGFLTSIQPAGTTITSGKVEDNKILVVTSDGLEIVLSAKKDGSLQAESLQAILTQAKIEGVILENVNFLFDKPILKTKQKN